MQQNSLQQNSLQQLMSLRMKRIFGRKSKDYRLFAAALAFGFTATLATLLIPQTSDTSAVISNDGSIVEQSASRSEETSTIAFAYASSNAVNESVNKGKQRQHYIANNQAPAAPLSMTEVVTINKGDTLGQVFEAFGIPKNLSAEAISSLKGIFSPRDFRIGQQITLLFKPNDEGGRDFRGYRFVADPLREIIIMDDSSNGVFDATVVEKELTSMVQAKNGVITGSLIGAANRAGVPKSVVSELIRVYSHSIDFQRDVHEGDRFEIMYKAKVDKATGKAHGKGELMYAQLTLRGKDHAIYRFEKDGLVDFYKADGSSNRGGLLKTPIDGARMSSGYGMRRHPVLGYSKMHKGIDFAAPTGTPIFAAGDGIVSKAGWMNGYGRYIKVSHNSGLSTAYAHMSRFAQGIRAGVRVKQGQVIGYVGATGRATGPHLHYEIIMNGRQVNPVGVKVPNSKQLAGRDLTNFKTQVKKLEKDYKQALAESRNKVAGR